jgi:hypothetical protein
VLWKVDPFFFPGTVAFPAIQIFRGELRIEDCVITILIVRGHHNKSVRHQSTGLFFLELNYTKVSHERRSGQN